MDVPYYPINDFGPAMKGMIIGGLGIFHVFLAQFAIGGDMLMTYFEWLSQTGRGPQTRKFVDGFFRFLVLISFVVGAVTGVGMWFTSIQVSPRTIGLMVEEFHWIWAIEWTFFALEIMAGYAFYRYGIRLPDRIRLLLLAIYSVAAWGSLFWINGILSWQLTPGDWLENETVWNGFFNPSFWPSLIFRTVVSMTIASLAACVVINIMPDMTREERTGLIQKAAHFLAPMILMPALGLWYFLCLPPQSREWVQGGSIAMTMFFAAAIGASLLIGAYAWVLLRKNLFINGFTAGILLLLAFAATAGGEFVREGVRKPYTVQQVLYSNAIRQPELEHLREVGSVTGDPYPLQEEGFPNEQVKHGAKVYRFQCSICHTLEGANALTHLAGSWSLDQQRMNISQLQRTKTFMPPFAGNKEDVEALVQWFRWELRDRPEVWEKSHDPKVMQQIQEWLDEVGTTPGTQLVREELYTP